jgi:hypothetical protein
MNSVKRALVIALLALISIVGGTTAAQAKTTAPVTFTYHWATGSNGIVVQQVGPVAKRWQLVAVVREWNSGSVINMHIGTCADFPTQHCVLLSSYDTGDTGAAGYVVIAPNSETPTIVKLNKGYWNWSTVDSKAVTCHELGHAVGFTHEEPSGCTSQDNREDPSKWELDTAAKAYAKAV